MNAPNGPDAPLTPTSSKSCPRCGTVLMTYDKLALLAGPVLIIFKSLAAAYIVGIVVVVLLLLPERCRQCGRIPFREFSAQARTRIVIRKIFVVLLLAIIVASAVAVMNALPEINAK
jgi:hypothetical protein